MKPKQHKCDVCAKESKYRCSVCPARYCSVACYKVHKETCVEQVSSQPAPSLEPPGQPQEQPQEQPQPQDEQIDTRPLRPLTSLKWPPEPDPAIFMDPLRRDDPKPLRHAELERIATSKPLREVLASPALVKVLGCLDSMPPNTRQTSLARILGVDGESLAKPAAEALLRASPPPLQDLLGERKPVEGGGGWWLGQGEGRVWIGEEERRVVKLWAGVTVQAIDGGDGDWGKGELGWQVGD